MKALLWILGICFIVFLGSLFLKPQLTQWIFADAVNVELYGEAEISEVIIRFTAEEIQNDTLIVFKKGEQLINDLNYIGYNYFIVDYKEATSVYSQFKTSKVSSHNYLFLISEQGDSVYFDLKIKGPDASQ